MSDTIGRITVPAPVASGLTFPSTIRPDFGCGMQRPWPVIVHRFGEYATKAAQRFQVGVGPRTFTFPSQRLNYMQRAALFAFYEDVQGSFQSFAYNAPQPDGSTVAYTVVFENKPLILSETANGSSVSFNLVEAPTSGPTYSVSATCTRYPSSGLETALLSQVQQIIPLVHIRVRESAVPDIYLSDRRCTVNGQIYIPRVLDIGEPGTNVLLTQSIDGSADNVQFVFGNADRAMTALANDTDLKYASIDLCLYHVNTGILWQFWKGFIQGYVSDGTAKFPVNCSDGLFQVMQMYPALVASRSCPNNYNDGVYCPWATAGASSGAVTAAGGDPTQCDYTWNGTNGCTVHGMTLYFRGLPAVPQSVNVKDNSTGFLGWDRNTVTATSIISDTIWGQAIPEIWCNQQTSALYAFFANALVVAVRDNGDYFDVLGIISAGPIGAYSIAGNSAGLFETNADGFTYLVAPLADGFPAQGLKITASGESWSTNTALGLRQVVGNDPIPSGDQSYEQFGLANIVSSPVLFGGTPVPLAFAAGIAFVELLYPKPSGFTPSPAEAHSLSAPIAQGMAGRTWTGGTAAWQVGLINPVWIAVNTYLRGIGMAPIEGDSGGTIAAQFAVAVGPNVIESAAICDTLVTPLLGTGTELQFQFQGTVGSQKPLRDWLKEILSCCLGYFTFSFGVLDIGIRINATPVDAFTIGNMLYQSLHLEPGDARFEHMVVSFADVAYQYQANTGEYVDKDHATYYGRPGSPLTSQRHIVGCSTLSQALRIAATEVREEIGGINTALHPTDPINPSEWRSLRKGTFKTTLLGLTSGVGTVLSITHPDAPGGSFAARIQSVKVMKDWSVLFSFQSVTDSMYALDTGPAVTAVMALPLPVLNWPIPLTVWLPWQVQAAAGDALFPSEYTFDADQEYLDLQDGSVQANIILTGKLPVNAGSPGIAAPAIGAAAVASTGGHVPGGGLLRVSVCALDTNGLPGPSSAVALVNIPTGTNTNSVILSGIQWPPVSNLSGYVLFASIYDDLICEEQTGTLTSIGTDLYSPTSVTLTLDGTRSGWGIPNPNVVEVLLKAKPLIHSGPAGVAVGTVGTNQLICSDLIDSHSSPVDWTGRACSDVGRPNASTPFASFNITAFDHTTGTLTLDRDPTGIVLGGGDNIGDALVIRNKADNLTGTPTLVTVVNDNGYQNVTNGYGGLTVNAEVGNLIRVIAGTGRGQLPSKITANTATQITFQPALLMDTTSVWIVEGPTWQDQSSTTVLSNLDPTKASSLTLPTTNYIDQPVLIAGFLVDNDGNVSPEGDAPLREDWIYGASSSANAYYNLTIVSGVVTPDLSKGFIQRVLLTQDVTIAAPINAPPSAAWTLIIDQDGTGNWTASPATASYFHNFNLISPPSTRNQINWILDPDGFNSVSGAPSIGQPIPA